MDLFTKFPEIGKHMPKLDRKTLLWSSLSGFTVSAVYLYYNFNYVRAKSGIYKISTPPPRMISRLGQLQVCQFYVRLYERTYYVPDICVNDYRPVLKNLCGIDTHDIFKKIYGVY